MMDVEQGFPLPDIPGEPRDAADVQLEVVEHLAAAQTPQLHHVLHVLHVAGDELVPRHAGGPLQHVLGVLGHNVDPGRLRRVVHIN